MLKTVFYIITHYNLKTKHLEDYIQMCVILNRFGIVADSKQVISFSIIC